MDDFISLLTRTGYRLTAPRRTVFAALASASEPLDIAALTKQCESSNRTSIYRTIELFIKLGIVTVVHIGWKKRYELAEPFQPHHHHLSCKTCGELITLYTPELEQLIQSIARQYRYTITSHHFELQGLCPSCRQKQ